MTQERNALKAGVFIIATIAIAIGIIISIKGLGRFIEPNQIRTVRFALADDIGGLREGDDVRLGGYKVGTVRNIDAVDLEKDPHIVIVFALPRKYELREGARVGVQTGITGASVLNIESLGRGQPLPENQALAGVADPKTALLASLGKASPRFESIMTKVDETTVPEVNKTVVAVREKFGNVSDRTSETMVEMRDLLGDTKSDFRGTVHNLNETTGTLRERLPETMDRLNSALKQVNDTLASTESALEDVKKTVANTREISASAKGLIVGNKSKIDGMITSLKTTGDNLKFASSEIRRSPWRLLYKPGKGEMANLNLYDSARQFAEGANDLNDAASALRDALANKEADEAQIKKLVERLDKSFANFGDVEEKLWTSVRQ